MLQTQTFMIVVTFIITAIVFKNYHHEDQKNCLRKKVFKFLRIMKIWSIPGYTQILRRNTKMASQTSQISECLKRTWSFEKVFVSCKVDFTFIFEWN